MKFEENQPLVKSHIVVVNKSSGVTVLLFKM